MSSIEMPLALPQTAANDSDSANFLPKAADPRLPTRCQLLIAGFLSLPVMTIGTLTTP
jgi:hypothetical protein